MRRARVLLTLLTGNDADLNLARRKVAHDRIVVLVHPGAEAQAEALRAREERVGAADLLDVVPVEGRDTRTDARTFEAVLDRHRDHDVVLNAAGGNAGLMVAALYTAYARGIETWFFQEGRADRLPVLHGLALQDRVDPMEAKMLVALPEDGASSRWLAETGIIPRDKVEKALRSLRKKGLVLLGAEDGMTLARVTPEGRYVRDHLVIDQAAQRA